jgi:hypothetical protein
MRRRFTRMLLAVTAAGGAALLTMGLAGPSAASAAPARAQASTPVIYTVSQAGYVTGGGRWFRYVQTTVKVAPLPAQPGNAGYAEVVLGGTSAPVYLAVKAGGGASSVGWSMGVPPFGMGGGAFSALAPKPGDLLRMSIYYDRAGHVFCTATDLTQGISQTVTLPEPSTVFTAAEAAGVVHNATVSAPASATKLWAFSGTKATTYSGVRGTLLGPWATSEIVDTTTGTAAGALVTSPRPLWNNGQNFTVWLLPGA